MLFFAQAKKSTEKKARPYRTPFSSRQQAEFGNSVNSRMNPRANRTEFLSEFSLPARGVRNGNQESAVSVFSPTRNVPVEQVFFGKRIAVERSFMRESLQSPKSMRFERIKTFRRGAFLCYFLCVCKESTIYTMNYEKLMKTYEYSGLNEAGK